MKRALLISIFVIAAGAAVADAAGVPETMDYQGVLTDTLGGFVPDGPYDFDFNLF